jgi:Zn-dependent protease
MLPVPPLDGSGALALVLPEGWVQGYQTFCRQPFVAILALIAVWRFAGAVFLPCFFVAVDWLYPGVHYG